MYRDLYDHARWYTLMQGQALQGLLARVRNENGYYIVTKRPHEVGRLLRRSMATYYYQAKMTETLVARMQRSRIRGKLIKMY